jgi:hypothetical protein
MNGIAYRMMDWGSEWAQKTGGDTQHQVLQVALHYLCLIHWPFVPMESNRAVREYA